MLLQGLTKLVAVIVVAGLAGLGIGTGLGELSGDTDSTTGAAGNPPAAPAPVTNTETTTTAQGVRVRVVSATLRPGSSRSGRRRKRARFSVNVRVTNRGSRRVVPARPVLRSGDARVRTDPSQDTDTTNLGVLRPGATGDVTLRFEIAGAVTERLRKELRARLTVAGRNVTTKVKVGGPVGRARGS